MMHFQHNIRETHARDVIHQLARTEMSRGARKRIDLKYKCAWAARDYTYLLNYIYRTLLGTGCLII